MTPTPPLSDTKYDVLVMLSGGPDSVVLLQYLAQEQSATPLALHFAGLSPSYETSAACAIARNANIDICVIEMGSFVDACRTRRMDEGGEGRRAIFGATTIYSAALTIAIAHQIPTVAVGLHQQDAQAYIEQSPQYLTFMTEGLQLVDSTCQLLAPFHAWTKAQVLQKGKHLGVDFGMTWSCILPVVGLQDGICSACRSRRAAFQAAGIKDPTRYANDEE